MMDNLCSDLRVIWCPWYQQFWPPTFEVIMTWLNKIPVINCKPLSSRVPDWSMNSESEGSFQVNDPEQVSYLLQFWHQQTKGKLHLWLVNLHLVIFKLTHNTWRPKGQIADQTSCASFVVIFALLVRFHSDFQVIHEPYLEHFR